MTRDVSPGSGELITSAGGLHEFLHRVEPRFANGRRPRAALDLEADSFHSYQEKICLVQINIEGIIALFDPLEGMDLRVLFQILDESELWFHGGDYDLSLLIKSYGWTPGVYYDTQIAARLCGRKHFGLAALASHYLGREMPKEGQRADWSKRPISAFLLQYGAEDVRATLEVAELVVPELEEKGRTEWFRESCDAALAAAKERPEKSRADLWRIAGCGKLGSRELAILRAVWLWRDREAERRDRPHFKVMNNEALLRYVDHVHSGGDVERTPKGIRGDSAAALMSAARAALASRESEWPPVKLEKKKRAGRVDERDVNRLREARDQAADALDIDAALIATRTTLEELVAAPKKADAILQKWQLDLLQEALDEVADRRHS